MNIFRSNVGRSARHVKSVAAVLAAALLATSSWLVLRADVPQVASGTWAPAGDVGAIPNGAASVALPDGRVLVAGGTVAGALSNGIATYDPTAGAWASGGNLVVARSGHAAALLKDGRVLFAGGTATEGPSFDIEIYDPATGVSAHAGDMMLARVNHAAATLRDGRVLIVGGFDGQSPLNLGEIFDPATGQSAGAAATMSTGRVKATATTLLDGHVLVAGGNDGTQDLASAEIFDAASGSFFATGAMLTARSGHVAVLLPDNNQVLIAGGMAAGAAVASAELYADWSDGFSNTPNPMSAARAGGIAGGLISHDLALVAGGGSTSGEFFGYATVKTDRTDYWPGEPVTVTGSGWQPGETVTLVISEDADTHYDFTYSAVADASGAITNAEFAPIENEVFHHFGKKFYVAARGAASAALNTFTDGNVKVAVMPTTDSANTPGHMFTVEEFTTAACTGTPTGTSTVGVAANKTANIGGTGTSTTVTAPAFDDQGTPFSAWFNTAGYVASGQALCITSTSSGSQTVTAVYGGVAKIAFTNNPINAATGACSVMGLQTQNANGAATPPIANTAVQLTTTSGSGAFYSNSSCTAPITSVTIASGNANSPAFYYKDDAGGTPTVTADASSTTSLAPITQLETITSTCTVPAGVSITPNGAVAKSVGDSLTFTASVTAGTPTLHYAWTKDGTPIGGAPDNASYTISPVALTDAGTYQVVVSNGCSPGVTSANNAIVSVNRIATALTVAAANGTYGGNTSAPLTATLTAGGSGVSGKIISFTLNGTSVGTATTNSSGVATLASASSLTGINAGSYSAGVAASFAQDDTYAGQTASNSLTVDSVQLSVKADDKSKTYDGVVFTPFTSSISGFVNGETESGLRSSGALTGAAAYSGAATTAVSASATPYPITPAVGTLTATNYTFTFVNGNLTINPKAATVTANAKSKFYGDVNPTLDAVVDGEVPGGDPVAYTLATTATAGSNVGTYPIEVTLGTNPNYAVTKTNALLTVNPKAATVTANAKSKFYGDVNPTLDAVVDGEVPGGDPVAYTLATTATAGSNVGTYAIEVTLGANPNYAVTKTNALLTVNKATLTVTADNKTKLLNAVNPTLTASYSGFVNGETLATSGVTGAPGLTTTALVNSPVGQYPITAAQGTLTAANYAFVFANGTLTVLYEWDGFLQPINDTAHYLGIMSRFKAGQTIPAKFDLKDANGVTVTQAVNPMFGFALIGASCGTSAPDSIDFPEPPSSVPVYTLNGGHYQYNWSTKGVAAGLYRIFAKLDDGTTQSVDICLSK